MEGLPVTIRLLDPPLHEFLPEPAGPGGAGRAARGSSARTTCDELETAAGDARERISEENPMLGTRGCRLGILYPEIYEMQVHAIMRPRRRRWTSRRTSRS